MQTSEREEVPSGRAVEASDTAVESETTGVVSEEAALEEKVEGLALEVVFPGRVGAGEEVGTTTILVRGVVTTKNVSESDTDEEPLGSSAEVSEPRRVEVTVPAHEVGYSVEVHCETTTE